MDYRDMLKTHEQSGRAGDHRGHARDPAGGPAFGIMRIDETGRVVRVPGEAADRRGNRHGAAGSRRGSTGTASPVAGGIAWPAWASTCSTAISCSKCSTKTAYQDFGKEVFPAAFRSRHVQVHLFDGYWEDIGTIRAFYEANLGLAQPNPPFQLVCPTAPVYSRARYLPPSLFEGAQIQGSLIADGCRIGKGAVIENSIIGLRCIIGENVMIRNSIVMG